MRSNSVFTLTEQNAPAIVQVCQRLDGIPLAIELAAARVRMLSVEQIAAPLEKSFRLLSGGSRAVPPRQQTLQATMDWSYALLTAEEQCLFQRLTVFAGSFAPVVLEPTPLDLDRLFAPYPSELVFYGHYHPFSDLQGRARYVNPGSLGCYNKAIARYSIVLLGHGQATIEHRSIPYDDTALFEAYERRQVPERAVIYRDIFGR